MFSIIVPFNNSENTLRRCIDSLLLQNVDKEIILVNDNSKDGSLFLCKNYEKKYNCIRIITSNGIGVSSARNTGIENSKGEIICFCDADDCYEYNILEKIDRIFFLKKDVSVIIGNLKKVKEEGGKIKVIKRSHYYSHIIDSQAAFKHIFQTRNICGTVCNKFYKKSVLQEIKFNNNLVYCEDQNFNATVFSKNKISVFITNSNVYNYYDNHNSVSYNKKYFFDGNGRSTIICAKENIKDRCNLNKSQASLVNYSIAQMAVTLAFSQTKNSDERRNLLKYFKKYNTDFLKWFYRINLLGNCKVLTKLIMIVLGIK